MQIFSLHILDWVTADKMIQKVIILLYSLALATAGTIGTHFSPATSVSSVYSSINNTPVAAKIGTPLFERTITQVNASPAPIYESVVSTHEANAKGLDGSQQTTFAKSLDTAYSSVNKYDTRITNNGILAHSVPTVYSSPIHASYLYSPGTYTVTSPLSNSVITKSISPIAYTTHGVTPIATKYSTPIVTKTITPVTSYTSQGGQAVKTTITYSEAPLVSHMTFTGLGTSYAW